MNRLYKDTFEKIRPTQDETERIQKELMRVSRGDQRKQSTLRRRYVPGKIAVAALAAVMVLGTTVFADEVKDLFSGFLNREEETAEYVKENVFQVSDGHVCMQVLELLSDEVSVQMTVKYEAEDETGKEWLNSIDKMENEDLYIIPDFQENTLKYGTNLSAGCLEMEEYRTDTERYFYVSCENSNWSPALPDGKFTYLLPDGRHTADMDISCNVPVYEYALQAEDGEILSEYYEPVCIRLSMLSYVIYGKSDGLFEFWISKDGNFSSGWIIPSEEEFIPECVRRVTFLAEDGTEILSDDEGFGLGDLALSVKDDNEMGYDCLVSSDIFSNAWEQIYFNEDAAEVMKPEEIAGIRLENGHASVEYTFTE